MTSADNYDKADDLETKKDDWTVKTVDVPVATDGKNVDLGAEFMLADNEINATPEERAAVFRKIDGRLLVMLVWIYMVQFSDKVSLGYASLMGIQAELALVGRQYSWASSVFYAGFLLAEFPAVYLLKRLPIGTFTSVNIIIWGVVLTMHAATTNYAGLITVRFLLGIFEAPITPAFMMLISMWYPRFEQGRRTSYFLAANGVGTLVCSPIAYGLSGITSSTIANWKILFILFGLVTFITGVFYFFFMPNSQVSVKWLSTREKAVAIDALKENSQGAGNLDFKWYQVKEAFMDPRTYIYFLFSACMNIPNGGVTSFGNLVIKGFGFNSRISLLLGMPGGAVDILAKLVLMRLSDRFKDRTLFAMIAIAFPFMGGLIMMLAPQDKAGPLLFGYYCISAAGASWGLVMICISNNTIGYTKKSVVNGVQIIAYGVGNWVGPQTFQTKDAPVYHTGKTMVAIFYGISLGLLMLLRLINHLENKKRDRLQAENPDKYAQPEDAALRDLTDFEQPGFRYIL